MAYYIDFHAITLDEYQGILQSADLVPSRRLLLNNIETIFAKIQSRGLRTLADLQDALKTKSRLQGFCGRNRNRRGIPESPHPGD